MELKDRSGDWPDVCRETSQGAVIEEPTSPDWSAVLHSPSLLGKNLTPEQKKDSSSSIQVTHSSGELSPGIKVTFRPKHELILLTLT